MTDLNLIINYLEAIKKLFEEEEEIGGKEPEGIYASRDKYAVTRKLRILKNLNPDFAALLKEEDRVNQKARINKYQNRDLIYKINKLSDKELNLEEYERELTELINFHLTTKQVTNKHLREIESKDSMEDNRIEPKPIRLKQDKIYELAEDLYDYRLTEFEIRPSQSRIKENYYIKVSLENQKVFIQFIPLDSGYQDYFLFHRLGYGFEKISFELIEEIWTYTHDRETETFDIFITTLSRILFEIVGATDHLLEVRYLEYD